MKELNDEKLLKEVVCQLVKIREERGLTQRQVYYDTGIHIGRIEMNKTSIALMTLNTLCNYYEISIGEIFSERHGKQ